MKKLNNSIRLVFLLVLIWGCEKALIKENQEDLNLQDFDYAWQQAKDNYPYFDLKGVDWDVLYNQYYPLAQASQGDEIYTVLISMFAHLKDGHMYLETEGGQKIFPWVPIRRKKDIYSFRPDIVGTYFDQEILTCSENNMNYQILPGNLGYLNIRSWSGEYGFGDRGTVFQYLSQTDGLIIDIRHNYGGDIKNIDKIVGYLIQHPIPKNPYYYEGEILQMDSIRPHNKDQYLKPVVLLVNGVSYSASEITTEIFKQQIPQATVVGDTTGGGSLGYLNQQNNGDFRLPSGKLFHIGNLDVRKYNNEPYENIGIIPDILLPQTEEDILEGRDLQLEYAMEYLKSK